MGGRWADLRPRANPTRPHGGIDISAPAGSPIVAPEAGVVVHFRLRRQDKTQWWKWPIRGVGQTPPWRSDRYDLGTLPWASYGYDLYGAVTVLLANGRAHLFCHSWFRQLLDMTHDLEWSYQEQPEDAEFPIELWHTFASPKSVAAGEQIAAVGNQGESTGAHVHWEIHKGWTWTDYKDRPDPEKLI